MTDLAYVGIDVSKKHLDYTWLPDGSKYSCENTEEGLDSLIATISKFEVGLITLEATGGYHNLAVRKLQQAGWPVAVVNPRQVRDLAKASGRLAKTDRLDAAMIARYGQVMQPDPQIPKDPVRVAIGNLTRRRNQLVTLRHMEKNHLENADAKSRQSIDLVMNLLTCQIDEI
jgi:transposase